MTDPDHRRWHTASHPFTVPVPLLLSLRHGRPDAPLVVFCHGMGETPERFLEHWPMTCALGVHVAAPAGPFAREERTPGGVRIGHAWYLYDGGDRAFRDSLAVSTSWFHDALAAMEAEHGLRPRMRALVGHSQGAYFGYVAALERPDRIQALVAAAGRLKTSFVREALSRPGPLEALILHGEDDSAVDPEAARRSHRALTEAGYRSELRLLPGGHGLPPDRDTAAAGWLARVLDLPSPRPGSGTRR